MSVQRWRNQQAIWWVVETSRHLTHQSTICSYQYHQKLIQRWFLSRRRTSQMSPKEIQYWYKSRRICCKLRATIHPCSNSWYRSTNSSRCPSLYPSDRALVLPHRRANSRFKRRVLLIRRHGSTYHQQQTILLHQAHSCRKRRVHNRLNNPCSATARVLHKLCSFYHRVRLSWRTCNRKYQECRLARGLLEAKENQWCRQR